jgi:hypothetical protein
VDLSKGKYVLIIREPIAWNDHEKDDQKYKTEGESGKVNVTIPHLRVPPLPMPKECVEEISGSLRLFETHKWIETMREPITSSFTNEGDVMDQTTNLGGEKTRRSTRRTMVMAEEIRCSWFEKRKKAQQRKRTGNVG